MREYGQFTEEDRIEIYAMKQAGKKHKIRQPPNWAFAPVLKVLLYLEIGVLPMFMRRSSNHNLHRHPKDLNPASPQTNKKTDLLAIMLHADIILRAFA